MYGLKMYVAIHGVTVLAALLCDLVHGREKTSIWIKEK